MIRRLIIVGFIFGGEVVGEEPACHAPNRFEYEHKVLEKLIYLEQFKGDATEKIIYFEQFKADATVKLLHLEQSKDDATVKKLRVAQSKVDAAVKLLQLEQSKVDAAVKLLQLEQPKLDAAVKLLQLEQPKVDAALKIIQLEQSKAIERIAAVERQLQASTTQSPQTTKSSSTYVRWGIKTCPNVTDTTLIYSGQVGGALSNHAGSGGYVCLPNDPSYDQYNSAANDISSVMYGAVYKTQNSPVLSNLNDFEVPCAVCLASQKTSLMIPGRTACYSGWTKEYQGYLMAEYYNYYGKGYVCMDKLAETLENGSANENGARFYATEGRCGSLRCPPYINGAELACVVCSTTS